MFWAIAIGGAAFDLVTKSLVFRWIGEPGHDRHLVVVPNVLDLRTSFNAGALWGLGNDLPHSSAVFAVASIIAGVFIYYYLFVLGNAGDRRQTIALALIMAGAIGNCYDRIAFGHVRDFVHIHVDSIGFNWAIFNFADNMLVFGAIFLMILALRPEPETSVPKAEAGTLSSPG
ncbi:MAG: signal peptidase II [Isosphaeraceae bacterium]